MVKRIVSRLRKENSMSEPTSSTPSPSPNSASGRWNWLIILSFLALLLICAVVFAFLVAPR